MLRFFGVYYPRVNVRAIAQYGEDGTARSAGLIDTYRRLTDAFTDEPARFRDPAFHEPLLAEMQREYALLRAPTDLFVCTTPLPFCLTLVLAGGLPLLVYVAELFDMAPAAWEGRVAGLLARGVRVLASSAFSAALVEYSYQLRVPAIFRMARYMPELAHRGRDSNAVLILRTDYWVDTNHGKLFLRLLYKFWTANPWIDLRFYSISQDMTNFVFGPADTSDLGSAPQPSSLAATRAPPGVQSLFADINSATEGGGGGTAIRSAFQSTG